MMFHVPEFQTSRSYILSLRFVHSDSPVGIGWSSFTTPSSGMCLLLLLSCLLCKVTLSGSNSSVSYCAIVEHFTSL